MKTYLSVSLSKKDIQNLIARYHFNDSDYEKIYGLYISTLPLICASAHFEIEGDDSHCNVLLTLGDGLDKLRNLYTDESLLTEAYMIECIGFDLLTSAYRDLVSQVQKESDSYVSAIHFLGEKYPLTLQDSFIAKLQPDDITATPAGMLMPSKSVSLVLELSTERPDCTDLFNTCATCANINCAHRFSGEIHNKKAIDYTSLPLTYGAQTIFKSQK